MTGKQRFEAAIKGDRLNPKLTLGLVEEPGIFDAQIGDSMPSNSSAAFLLRVQNPFGLARSEGVDLNETLKRDPNSDLLDQYATKTAERMRAAEAVFYVLDGAYPAASTPMQYGGYYLEKDRDLLTEAMTRIPVVLFLAGTDSPYLDFVSDLPCSVFAWDSQSTGITSAQVRALRPGAQASMDPDSEWTLSVEASNHCTSLKEILHV